MDSQQTRRFAIKKVSVSTCRLKTALRHNNGRKDAQMHRVFHVQARKNAGRWRHELSVRTGHLTCCNALRHSAVESRGPSQRERPPSPRAGFVAVATISAKPSDGCVGRDAHAQRSVSICELQRATSALFFPLHSTSSSLQCALCSVPACGPVT